MPDPTGFYQRNPGQRAIASAQVSTRQPAPGAFTDPLFVVLPHDPNHAIRIEADEWPQIHGNTLPALGADVLVAFDELYNCRVLWWRGAHS